MIPLKINSEINIYNDRNVFSQPAFHCQLCSVLHKKAELSPGPENSATTE